MQIFVQGRALVVPQVFARTRFWPFALRVQSVLPAERQPALFLFSSRTSWQEEQPEQL
jgi:hypothetical protein